MFRVKFMKYFVYGALEGTTVDADVMFPSLESAVEYTKFLLAHTSVDKPVEAIDGSHYSCHCIRVENETPVPYVSPRDISNIDSPVPDNQDKDYITDNELHQVKVMEKEIREILNKDEL